MITDRFEELEAGGPPNERSWRLGKAFCRVTDQGDDLWVWDAWIPRTRHWEHGETDSETKAVRMAQLMAVRLTTDDMQSPTGSSERHGHVSAMETREAPAKTPPTARRRGER